MPGESASSPRRIEAAEKRARALTLRKAGKSLDQIVATGLYESKGSASKAISQALRELPAEDASELRALQNERYEALLEALWPAAMKGRWLATDRILRLMEQQAKLNGLNQPDQLIVSSADSDFDAAYRELQESMARLDEQADDDQDDDGEPAPDGELEPALADDAPSDPPVA